MVQYLRKLLINPIAIALAGAIVVYIVVPHIIRARETARNSYCVNNLFQHSGSHPSDSVQVDRNWNFIYVGSCPLCSDSRYGIRFVVVENGTVVEYLNEGAQVPDATREDAKERLRIYKTMPRYRESRQTFPSELRERMFAK